LEAETNLANVIVSRLPGAVAAIVADNDSNSGHVTFMRLKARPHMIQVASQADVSADRLIDYDTVIVVGRHNIVDPVWRPIFQGQQLTVFRRGSLGQQTTSPAPSLGSAAGTGY
jgi:hypothetical protein